MHLMEDYAFFVWIWCLRDPLLNLIQHIMTTLFTLRFSIIKSS